MNENNGSKKKVPVIIFLVFLLAIGFVWYKKHAANDKGVQPQTQQTTNSIDQSSKNDPVADNDVKSEEKVAPAPVNPDKVLGIEAYKRGEFAAAIANLNKAISANQTDAEAMIYKENSLLAMVKAPTWTIAVAGPFTGASRQKGEAELQGVALAQAQINQAGGILGKKIKVVVADDESTAEGALKVAQELCGNNEVLAVIGHINSSATIAAAPIYNAASLVNISPTSTSPSVSDQGDYTFRVCNDDNAQGKLLAKWAVKSLNKRSIGLFFDPADQYSQGMATVFRQSVRELGGQVVIEENFTTGKKGFGKQAQAFKNANTDLVFIAGAYTEAALLAKELRKAGSDAVLLGGDGLYSQGLIEVGKSNVEGSMFSTFFHAGITKASIQQFVKQFGNKFAGGTPNARAALSYDAFKVVVQAIKLGGTNRQDLQKKLASIGTKSAGFPGVSGTIAFDANGDTNRKEMVILKVQAGKIVPVQLVQP